MNLLTNKELFETLKKKFIRTKFFSERLELLLGVVPSQIVGLKKIHLKSINNKNNKPKENSKASSEFEEKKSQDQKGFINLPTDILTQNTLDQSSDDDEHDKNQNFHDDHKTKSLNHNQKENILNINKINPYGYDRFKSDESDNENENENGNDKNNENTNNFDCLQQTQNENKIIIPNNIEFNREVLYLLENLTGISRRSLEWGLSSFIERNFGLHNIHPHNKQKIIFGKASLKKNKKKEKINLRKKKKNLRLLTKNKQKKIKNQIL
ncbi:hypothetical protein M0812_03360 [Anaeramoeba flamelloides]|uniref:Uncharacterized protein n=1 Tax=Anaeramoeba flamelloides TaxID=1746091 RepID=A0AAV8ADE4_9EUKA|nr:hypothetical protein M0812_03360 [Anaeramoeba flamelloides]